LSRCQRSQFASWDDAFEFVGAQASEAGSLVLALDEFQWLWDAQPAIDSILQRHVSVGDPGNSDPASRPNSSNVQAHPAHRPERLTLARIRAKAGQPPATAELMSAWISIALSARF
jgi:hypothetical protein